MNTYAQIADKAWAPLQIAVRKRRIIKGMKSILYIVIPLFLLMCVVMIFMEDDQPIGQPVEIYDKGGEEGANSDFLISESNLLEELSFQGPILIHLADGSQKIILTRPSIKLETSEVSSLNPLLSGDN